MKFDFVIGNPPYQEETESDSTRKPPVYNLFMDESYKVGHAVELITPARFLFNAGYTPKVWNEQMLNDPHFTVLSYEPDGSKIFSNTDIKGGIVISYRDIHKDFGAIGVFTRFPELNSIIKKVTTTCEQWLDSIISSPLSYQLTDLMKKDNPDSIGRLRTSAFSALSQIFFDEEPHDSHKYIRMIGLEKSKRVIKYVRDDYICDNSGTLNKWTLLLPKAIGSGEFGEKLSIPIIAEPGLGYTQTFIAIGCFKNQNEAENLRKYVQTKFARTMLGVLKITQDNPGPKWKYVPLQDFTFSSDIDWSVSVAEIDRQLYKKYNLSEEEITFIETKVKEMA